VILRSNGNLGRGKPPNALREKRVEKEVKVYVLFTARIWPFGFPTVIVSQEMCREGYMEYRGKHGIRKIPFLFSSDTIYSLFTCKHHEDIPLSHILYNNCEPTFHTRDT
jgi:hypothetical protein